MSSITRSPRRAGLVNQTSEYGLRALAILSGLAVGESMRAADLAERAHVPPQYLSKVLRQLVRHGLLRAQRGHHGGFSLARPAATIRVADVLAALGGDVPSERCAFGWGKCSDEHPCPLHPMWNRLTGSYRTWTSTTTLADVDLKALRGRPRR